MATTFDVTFFKIAVYNKITDQPTADRCIAFINEQGQSGRAVKASDVLLSMRIANPQIVARLTQMTEAALGQQTSNGQAQSGLRSATLENAGAAHRASARHAQVPPPSAAPGPAPSSARQQALPPSGRQHALPASGRQTALPPSGRQPSLPASGRQTALPPSGRQPSLPASGRQQALPGGPPPVPARASGRQQPLPARASSRRLSRVATPLTPPPNLPWEAMEPGEIEFGPRIAEGPIGPVYSGKNRRSGSPLAIKILSPRFTKYPMLVQRIIADLQKVIQAQMTCGFCAGPRLVVEKDNYWVMAFDFVRGRTLEDLAKEWGPSPAERVIRIGLQLAQALAFSHSRGVSHGDVRPANVFIDMPTAGFRLIDYGLARASALARGYARFGVPFGHPQYLAPEVIPLGLTDPTPAQDLYALGIMLYELAVGRRPFDSEDIQQILVSQLKQPLPPPPAGVLPRPLAELIQSLAAKDPDRRLKSAEEAVQKLHALSQVDLAEVSDAEAPPDWLQTADDLAPVTSQWSEEKITAAKSLEPNEWDPDEEEDDPDFIAQSATADVDVSPASSESARPAPEPVGYGGALAAAEAAVEGGRAASAPPTKGDAGQRFRLQAEAVNSERRSYARTASILIVFAALTYLGLAFGIGHFSAEETRKARMVTGPVAPVIPEVNNDAARVDAEKALAAKRGQILAKLQEDLGELRSKKAWPAALKRIDGAFAGTKTDRASEQNLSDIRSGVVEAARADLKTSRDRARALSESGKLEDARQALVRFQPRLIPEIRQDYTIAFNAIAAAERRATRAKSAAPEKELQPWQKNLAAFFQGELTFKKRDVLGRYRFANKDELGDFDHGFSGARFGDEQAPGVELLAGAKQPKRLLFPVPFEDLISLDIEYDVLGAPGPDASLAFLIGIEEDRRAIGSRLELPQPIAPKDPEAEKDPKARLRLLRLTGKDPEVRFAAEVDAKRGLLWKARRKDQKPRRISLRKNGPRLSLRIDGKRLHQEQFDQARGLFGLEIQALGIKLRSLKFRAFALPDEAAAWVARQERNEDQ